MTCLAAHMHANLDLTPTSCTFSFFNNLRLHCLLWCLELLWLSLMHCWCSTPLRKQEQDVLIRVEDLHVWCLMVGHNHDKSIEAAERDNCVEAFTHRHLWNVSAYTQVQCRLAKVHFTHFVSPPKALAWFFEKHCNRKSIWATISSNYMISSFNAN